MEEKRLAVISVIVENRTAARAVNEVLSVFGDCVLGRMGIPDREHNVSIITVIVDALPTTINSVTGKLGMIKDVNAKTMMR